MFAFLTVNFNELSENYLTKKEMHSYFIHQVICKYPELLSAAFINLLLKAMTDPGALQLSNAIHLLTMPDPLIDVYLDADG